MPTVSTVSVVRQVKPNESSRFRSPRDHDDVRQKYKDIAALQKQIESIQQSNLQIANWIGKMRRRILGGVGSSSSGLNFRGEFDPTASYAVNDVVVIRAGSNTGSYVAIQPSSAQSPKLPDTGNLYWLSLSGNAPSLGAWMV